MTCRGAGHTGGRRCGARPTTWPQAASAASGWTHRAWRGVTRNGATKKFQRAAREPGMTLHGIGKHSLRRILRAHADWCIETIPKTTWDAGMIADGEVRRQVGLIRDFWRTRNLSSHSHRLRHRLGLCFWRVSDKALHRSQFCHGFPRPLGPSWRGPRRLPPEAEVAAASAKHIQAK